MFKRSNSKTPGSREVADSVLNEVIRNEQSAVNAYSVILSKYKHSDQVHRLKQMHLNHLTAVAYWKRVQDYSSDIPELGSCLWNKVIAEFEDFQNVGDIISCPNAINALRDAEKNVLELYNKLLNEGSVVEPHIKNDISYSFIPRQKRHIEGLEKIMEKQ